MVIGWIARSALFAVVATAGLLGAAPVDAQERWASQASNNEADAPVAWADNREDAMRRAVERCSSPTRSCASRPAVTNDMQENFYTFCCASPKQGCLVVPSIALADAVKSAKKTFGDAGYGQCSLWRARSAASGRTLNAGTVNW